MTNLRQAAQEALDAWDNPTGMKRLCVAMDALRTALEQQQAEPVAYYHPHKGFYWAKPTYISAPIVVDVPPVPLYVKWIAAQRPWQGLTDEEIHRTTVLLGFNPEWKTEIGMAHAIVRNLETKLKERNT